MKAIGEFHHDHANVVGHRQQHFPEILRLLFFTRCEMDLADLGYAIDDMHNFGAEEFFDFFQRRKSVFDDIVQKTDADRNRVHLHFG